MKKVLVVMLLAIVMTSCMSVREIGKVNMISTRNVDPALRYRNLTTYSGGSTMELARSRARTIEDAVDQTVRKIPGGEFLMNAKIYLINNHYIAVEGDVWGLENNAAYRGFKVGDKVMWRVFGGFKSGIIKSLKDDHTCVIATEDGTTIEKRYDDISKSE